MKAGTFPEGIRCKHKSKPAEPFAKERELGHILRITPGSGINPAQAFVDWGEYTTWERLHDLEVAAIPRERDSGE